MIMTDIVLRAQVRNPVVQQAVEAIDFARLNYQLNPCELTRYQLVVAQERLVSICRVLGLA